MLGAHNHFTLIYKITTVLKVLLANRDVRDALLEFSRDGELVGDLSCIFWRETVV